MALQFANVHAVWSGGDLHFQDNSGNDLLVVPASGAVSTPVAGVGNVQYLKLTLTAAQVKALHGTPVTLIASPASGQFIQLVDAALFLNFNTTAFTLGSTVQLVENSVAIATTTNTLVNNGSSIFIQMAFPAIGTTAHYGGAASALTITAASTEFATGDSTIDVHLWYSIVTL